MMIFFLAGSYPLRAAQAPGGEQDFKSELDSIKNPFEDGFPKPVVTVNKKIHHEQPNIIVLPISRYESKPFVQIQRNAELPDLKLQGVIAGEDIHQAIINDQVVPLLGTIEGARVDSVSKEGVELTFKGKKFFLKVD